MAITQAEAIEQVRSRLDEPSSIYWTEKDLRIWINDIAKDMARRTECLRDTYAQAVTTGDPTYTPAFTNAQQPYRIYRAEYTPTGQSDVWPLEYRDRNTADEIWGLSQQITQGIPAIWTSWGWPPNMTLQIYPSPSQDGTVTLYYYALPTSLATDDASDQNTSLDVVDGWEDVLVDGVEYKAKRRDNDQSWVEAKQEYEEHLAAMADATTRFTDAAGVIVTPNGSYVPGWLYGGEEYLG